MKKSFLYLVLIFFFIITSITLYDICVKKHDEYLVLYNNTTTTLVKGSSARRGRILDVNGKVLVDNEGINSIYYNRLEGSSAKEEVSIAYKLGEVLKFDESKYTTSKLKSFYLVINDGCDELITEEEWELYKTRKLTKSDIDALKYERITEELLDELTLEDKNASYIYYILKTGYYYQDKLVASSLSDEDIASIIAMNLPGVKAVQKWTRVYPYGEVLRSLFGSVSTNGVPLELKDYYLEKGVSIDSTVGTSFLELQYDEYLRGKDAVYEVSRDGSLVLVEEEVPGSDLYLSIDIDIQLEVESILKEEMTNAKKYPYSNFYNHSYILIGHPKTGEIVAVSGLMLSKDHFIDITANIIHSSYTVGSIVKGATISVGYANDLIQMGTKVQDSCIKVYGVTKKCSWTSLGLIDDVDALAQSSNYFQFLIATRLTNPNYTWNSKLNATKEHFDIYRNMLASYGLGTKTGIDLPNEQIGIIGKTVSDDLLLNLTIGQYDTYTPIEVFQYINTLANDGVKVAPSLMNKIVGIDSIVEHTPQVLGTVELEPEKIKRIQKGLNAVMNRGTGRNYTDHQVTSAGKTGTSETFVDSNNDGKIDTSTTSTSFIMYAPFENPEYSIVIMSPNISSSSYKYSLNLRVNRKIVQLFEFR